MIDLHTHTFMSDGVLVASELIRRASCKGYRYLAITDHADASNMEMVIEAARKAAASTSRHWDIGVLAGVELTHIPPPAIPELVAEARVLGAEIVIVHGETIVEPVEEGTNRAAIRGGADILSHPGLISRADARMAAGRGVHLEITTRGGHSLANGHVARVARAAGAPLILGTDSHGPGDLATKESAEKIALGAGMSPAEVKKMFVNAEKLAKAKTREL